MLNNPTRILFLMTLILGSLITISSPSWLGAWLGLEINLLSFIPLMSNSNNQFATEAALKYFLTQALASAMLLFTILSIATFYNFNFKSLGPGMSMNIMMNSTLLLKMGAAPFHFWFPGVMEGLDWMTGLILMTWQKVAPLMLVSYIFEINLFSTIIILFSVLIGSLGGLNQTSLRKIMAYSSINHLGWMLSGILLGENYFLTYFCFYIFLSTCIVLIFSNLQFSHINQLFSSFNSNNTLKLIIFSNLLSLGGLPPFLGFYPKWIIIQSMVASQMIFIISVMVMMTLITLYFYLRLGYAAFMLTQANPKWTYFYLNSFSPILLFLTFISLSGLPLCSALMSII